MIKKFFADKETINYVMSKGAVTFLFRMVAMAFSFITMWFITRFYGEATFGSYTVALTVMQITVMIFALGIPTAFLNFTGELNCDKKSKGLLLKAAKITIISSLIPLVIFFFGANFISQTIFHKANLFSFFIILALSISTMILHEILCYFFISIKKFVTYGLFMFVIPNVLFMALLIIFNYLNLPNYFSFLSYTLSIALTVLIGLVVVFFDNLEINHPKISTKKILEKSTPMMMSGIFLLLLNWTDILMLGRIESESQIGIYNVAFKIGYLALFFVVSMNVVIMPKVSELFHQNEFDKMRKVINKATQVVILLTIPLALIIILFSKFILSLFGTSFIFGSKTLILITLGALFNAMTGNVDQILNMTNNQKLVRNIFFAGFVLNVVLNLFLIPKYGIEGAALSSLITNIIVNLIFVYIIKKKLGFYTFM
jgi:O-antigen/teichoic acid export membrane protein